MPSTEKLRQYFETFGAVQDAVVMKDPVSRRSRGFGFITFEHASYVDNALAQDVHTIDSRKVNTQTTMYVTIFLYLSIRLKPNEQFLEMRCLVIRLRPSLL